MGKFNTGLVKEVAEQKQFEQEQKKLKEQHNIENENVVVVEKNNMVKFFVNTLFRIFRYLATVALLCLAAVGLTALVYPAPRANLITIFFDVLNQVKTALGM